MPPWLSGDEDGEKHWWQGETGVKNDSWVSSLCNWMLMPFPEIGNNGRDCLLAGKIVI